MSADQVKPEPEKAEANVADASDAGSNQATEQEATTAALQTEVQNETGQAGAVDSNDNGTSTTDAVAEGDKAETTAEGEDTVSKLQKDGLASTIDEANLAKLTPAERAELEAKGVIPKVGFRADADSKRGLQGRRIDLDGSYSLQEGESRTTNDAVIKHNGQTIARFDDADVSQLQFESNIDLNIPEGAETKTIEGVGKHSVVKGEDGTDMEIIQAEDGSVHIRKGGEYVSMTTGFNGVVTEGADAKASFEALAEKIEDTSGVQTASAQPNLVALAQENGLTPGNDYEAADQGTLSLPAMAVTEGVDSSVDGVREIDVDGKISVAEGESRVSNDAVVNHDGQQIVEFDDADMIENQWSAKINVTLPENAKSTSVEGAGKHSLLESKDGVSTEVIEAEDGSVYIRKGNEYISMSTGFNGVVTEGADAKAAFEAEAKKYDLGAKSYEYGMVHRTDKSAIKTADGQDLVTVGHDGKITTNIPSDAYVNKGSDNTTYAMLNDGTEMIVGANGATMVRNTDGTLMAVSADGSIEHCSDDSAWQKSVEKFGVGDQTNVGLANDQDNRDLDFEQMLHDDFMAMGAWYPGAETFGNSVLETADGGSNQLPDGLSEMSDYDFLIGFGALDSDAQDEFVQYGKNPSLGDLEYSKLIDASMDGTEKIFEEQGDQNKIIEGKDGLTEILEKRYGGEVPVPGKGTNLENIDAILTNGFEGMEGVNVTDKVIDGTRIQIDKNTGIKRLENLENGNVTLEFPNGQSVAREMENGEVKQETWRIKGEDGKFSALRREGPDTWSGVVDGVTVSKDGPAEVHSDTVRPFTAAIHGNRVGAGDTADRRFLSDGANSVTFGKNGEPTELNIGDQKYTFCPHTGKPVNSEGNVVESGDGIDYEIQENGRIIINGNMVLSANRNRGRLLTDGAESEAGTDTPATSRRTPPFKPLRHNPNFRRPGETPAEGDDRKDPPVWTSEKGRDPEKPVELVVNPDGTITNKRTGTTTGLNKDTNEVTWTDRDGNEIGSIDLDTGVGQVGDFKFYTDGVEDTTNGMGFRNGDVYDYNNGSVVYSDSAGWNADYLNSNGRTEAQQVALEAAAESKANTAVGQAQAVAAKVAAAVQSGNVSAIMCSMGEVAAAYGAISGAVACAIDAGDYGLAGMLNLQTSQVNAAAGSVVATTVKVQDVNRMGGDLTGDQRVAQALTQFSRSISNPLIQRKQILRDMGRVEESESMIT